MNFIYYNALNDIRYLSVNGFKDQIQNSLKMVYLILGHPVGLQDLNSPLSLSKLLVS